MLPPDYQNYSDKELAQALASIDSHAYPKNFKILLSELKGRQKIASASHQQNPVDNDKPIDDRAFLAEYWDPARAKKEQSMVSRTLGYLTILLFLGVFSLPAYFNSFLLGQKYHALFTILAWACAVAALLFSVYYSMQNKALNLTAKQRRRFGIETSEDEQTFAWVIKCLFALCCGLACYFVAIRTLPVLAHNHVVEKVRQTIIVTVADKSHRYRRKHCNGKVYLEEFKHSHVDYICAVLSRKKWENVRVGDKLRLFGTQSKLGFLVTGARKIQ